jgi:hypothetical protein
MGLLRRKKLDIRVPMGKNAVNFRKLLFLPIKDTQDLLANSEWECVRIFSFSYRERIILFRAALADSDISPNALCGIS